MTHRHVGSAIVHRVEELCGPGFIPDRMFPRFDRDAFEAQRHWMFPEFVDPGTGRLIGSIHTWVVRTRHHTILIDTCLGNHKRRSAPMWNELNTSFLDRLRAVGVAPEQVDIVMCTHLHVDHVGWNTQLRDGRWVPTFPNARYLFARKEYDHWQAERAGKTARETNDGSFDDSVLPVIEAGKAVLIGADHQPDAMLTIEEAPGHTPGSIVIKLADGGREALFSGDIMHHPIQVYHPDWSSQFCWDPAMSAATRQRVLEHCAEHDSLLCAAHFPGPNAGYVRAAGNDFRMEWDRS